MVLLKHFLAAAALLASAVIAADEPNTDSEAAAFWSQLDTIAARDVPAPAIVERAPEDLEERADRDQRRPNSRPPKKANPYHERRCPKKLDIEFPKKVTCDRNHCFRSFLSTRDNDRHCPSEAFGFCCLWLSAGDFGKKWAVKNDYIYKKAPYTKACRDRRDHTRDVIRKIDDVCGCTIKQKVSIEVDTEYFKLRNKKAHDPVCRPRRN